MEPLSPKEGEGAALLPPLPPIPAKRYFTIGEVAELCALKPHVLRYWEQEFAQLKPVKRRGNRRYYQHHEVLLVRRSHELLYQEGFTINGAKHQLEEAPEKPEQQPNKDDLAALPLFSDLAPELPLQTAPQNVVDVQALRQEMLAISHLLSL